VHVVRYDIDRDGELEVRLNSDSPKCVCGGDGEYCARWMKSGRCFVDWI
jgi:hypothetical protein